MQIIISITFALIGALTIYMSITDNDIFFSSPLSDFFVKSIGRKGSRFFYGAIGAVLMLMSIFYIL
ncbi:MAG: immunity 17 family protein [Clostridiales bacterium]|jgi:hypothetical protein|nr:immunity 17 family protein [Clostridiales bacterium]